MKTNETLAHQFELFYRTMRGNLDGMTAAHSMVQPEAGGNCANWIVGHLTSVQNEVCAVLGQSPVWASDQLERAHDDPIVDPGEAIEWEPMVERLLGSEERVLAGLAALDDEALAEGGFPHPFGGTATRAQLLTLLAFHQSYHAGQLGLSRRLAGLPGVIRGPAREPAEA